MNIAVPVRSPKKFRSWSLLFLLLGGWVSGCSTGQDGSDTRVLARVGDEVLTMDRLDHFSPTLVDSSRTEAEIEDAVDRWIEETLIRQEAEASALMDDPVFRMRLERVRNRFVADEYQQQLIRSSENQWVVTDQEARDYFQANRDQFELEEPYVRFRHLTTERRVDAVEARQDLMNGRSWEEVAREYSVDAEERIQLAETTLPRSRALRGHEILQQFLDVIGITEISPIQLSQGQYHFIQLLEERAAGESPDMEWLVEEIKVWLQREKARRFINSYKRNLYLQAESEGEVEKFELP